MTARPPSIEGRNPVAPSGYSGTHFPVEPWTDVRGLLQARPGGDVLNRNEQPIPLFLPLMSENSTVPRATRRLNSAFETMTSGDPDVRVDKALSLGLDVLLVGDAAAMLREVPSRLVQTAVTSPPYWSLRDYDVEGQIGRDESLPEFIKSLVTIFDEVRRVLRDDGTRVSTRAWSE